MHEVTESEERAELLPRRRLLGWLSRAFLSLWGLGVVWVTGSFLESDRADPDHGRSVLPLGPVDSMAIGEAMMVRHGPDPIFVVRKDETTLIGLSGVCTHLRCGLAWNPEHETLDCPCHRGAFDLSGNVLRAPATRPLRRYSVETRLGNMYLHL